MAQQDKLTLAGTFNHASTGLFKNNTTGEIAAEDSRTLVTNLTDSVPFTLDDSYVWPFPSANATGTDTYAATLVPAITAYVSGQKIQLVFANANTGAATINLNALGPKAITKNGATALASGDISAGQALFLYYDGTQFQVQGGGGTGTVTSVTGTTNRITSSGGATPVINIDAAYDAAITAQIAAAQVGLWDDRGTFSAAGGAYPSSGGSGTAGAILKGDIWTISVAGTLPTGQVVEIGDTVRALIDTPGNTQANWAILQNNIGYVPENIANKATGFGTLNNTLYPTTQAVSEFVIQNRVLEVAFSDKTTPITAGTDKENFGALYTTTILEIWVFLGTVQASGSIFTVDVNVNGSTMLSTKITVDNGESTSLTAVAAAVISNGAWTKGDKISIDVDQVGNGTALAGKIVFRG